MSADVRRALQETAARAAQAREAAHEAAENLRQCHAAGDDETSTTTPTGDEK